MNTPSYSEYLEGVHKPSTQKTITIEVFSNSYAKEQAGSYQEALNQLKNVYDETSYPINLRLGWLAYLSGKYDESVSYYQKCIEIAPNAIEPKLGITYPLDKLQQWSDLREQYENILAIDANHIAANAGVGYIAYLAEEHKIAEKHYQKLVNLY